MSPINSSANSDFISLSVAVTLVSYSRDYLARLAREGKIKSQQIDKQWFVSRESLLNYFETSAIEDSVKKRVLSLSRKNDLEVKDFYARKILNISAKQTLSGNRSLALSILILCGGLFCGLFLQQSAIVVEDVPDANFAQVLSALKFFPPSPLTESATQPAGLLFSDVAVMEVTENIPMQGGVVLFPAVSERDALLVETLFSDDVAVVVTSTTTGFVRAKNSDTELPFVRIPNEAP